MVKKSLIIAFALMFAVSMTIYFPQTAHASPSPNIMLSYAYCPSEVYIGEPFAAQVNITNLGLEPHNYTLVWRAKWLSERGYSLYSYGVINPGDEITSAQSFIFLESTYYFINVTLLEDNRTPVNSTEWMITVVTVGFAITHWIDTCPITPGHSFNVNITIRNVGNTLAYGVTLRLKPPTERKLKVLSQLVVYDIGDMKSGESNTTQLLYNSTTDIKPGVYLISFILEYLDERQVSYRQTYDLYIEISSVEQEIENLNHRIEILQASKVSLENEFKRQWLNTLYISITLLVVIILTASLNYYFAQKLKRLKVKQ